MAYGAFRSYGYPTMYPSNLNPVLADVLLAGFVYAACIVAFSFLVIMPGIRGKERKWVLIRGIFSISLGAIIMLTNYGQSWEVAHVKHKTAYKATTGKEVEAEIGVKIGLRSVNITLKADDDNEMNETINYNERFTFGWQNGRIGFGPYSSVFNQEFRAAQHRGLPYPILTVAEYFTLDGEGIRWGRHYRQAGFYAHIMMWLAFPLWVLTNVLFFMVISYGAMFLAMTGGSMLTAIILYSSIRNSTPLHIQFDEHIELSFHYGASYFVTLVTGLITLLAAAVIYFMDLRYPNQIHTFFGLDILQDYEDFYADPHELGIKTLPDPNMKGHEGSRDELVTNEVQLAQNDVEAPQIKLPQQVPVMRRRAGTKFAKSAVRKPLIAPRRRSKQADAAPPTTQTEENDDIPLYENVDRTDTVGYHAAAENVDIAF